ncbi:MAG TPA: CAP domain-containing protein [Syntrophomonadaceae bacterium]|nr:CAP domain-containing protein [Syntrophomonadaceae bacterium]
MVKRLITAGMAVWLGFICVHTLPVFNPTPVSDPAPVIVNDNTPAQSVSAPEAAPAPAEITETPDVSPAPQPEPKPAPQPAPVPQKQPAKTNVSRSSSSGVQTPAPATPSPSRGSEPKNSPAMASEMLKLINAERAQQGLAALVLDSRLSNGAYLKSKDMGINSYFSHTSPTYGSPFQMMKSLGITYRAAAENIARNRTVSAAHTAFMNSPGHRDNILDDSYRKVGLGFYQQGKDLYVTQWFTN